MKQNNTHQFYCEAYLILMIEILNLLNLNSFTERNKHILQF